MDVNIFLEERWKYWLSKYFFCNKLSIYKHEALKGVQPKLKFWWIIIHPHTFMVFCVTMLSFTFIKLKIAARTFFKNI